MLNAPSNGVLISKMLLARYRTLTLLQHCTASGTRRLD